MPVVGPVERDAARREALGLARQAGFRTGGDRLFQQVQGPRALHRLRVVQLGAQLRGIQHRGIGRHRRSFMPPSRAAGVRDVGPSGGVLSVAAGRQGPAQRRPRPAG
ncbi:hypothetical protein ABXN37_21915 [Piscinibacter sakaiensis]|uniref:hypothetical protein n=1 Tax=Piscinibacter sakaiensis TaxID=1547922 RepID=UPI00372C8EE4